MKISHAVALYDQFPCPFPDNFKLRIPVHGQCFLTLANAGHSFECSQCCISSTDYVTFDHNNFAGLGEAWASRVAFLVTVRT